MASTSSAASGRSVGVVSALAVLAVLLGVLTVGYGLLLVPQSALGGGWIAAIGLSLLLSGAFATERVGDRLGLAVGTRRTLSLVLLALAALLLIAFVVVNVGTFEAGEMRS